MRRLGLKLLTACVSLLVVLLGLEVVFRLLDVRGYHEPRTREWEHALVPKAQLPPGIPIRFKPHAHFDFNYDSNPRGYFNENDGLTYRTNNHGFRGPDVDMAKPPGVRRVMLLGDSFTFGEGVKLEHTLASQLQALLRSRLGPDIEVLNFGVSAWGTVAEITYLEREGLSFDPDLVVVVYVLNDANYAAGLDLWDEFRGTYETRALRGSYVASYLYAVIARGFYSRRYVRELVDSALLEAEMWDKSFTFLRRGNLLARRAGFEYLVAIFPFLYGLSDDYPFRPLHEKVHDFCAWNDIRVVDLFPAFEGRSYRDLWVHPSDQHPNEKGHRIGAEALADYIVTHHLLDDE